MHEMRCPKYRTRITEVIVNFKLTRWGRTGDAAPGSNPAAPEKKQADNF